MARTKYQYGYGDALWLISQFNCCTRLFFLMYVIQSQEIYRTDYNIHQPIVSSKTTCTTGPPNLNPRKLFFFTGIYPAVPFVRIAGVLGSAVMLWGLTCELLTRLVEIGEYCCFVYAILQQHKPTYEINVDRRVKETRCSCLRLFVTRIL